MPKRAEGDAGGGGIGGVGLDEQGGPVAAQQIAARNSAGMLIDELHLAAREQIVAFRLGLHLRDEIEVGAVLHRVEQRAAVRAVVGEETRRRAGAAGRN